MSVLDIVIVAAVVGWAAYVLIFRRKKNGCSGDCANCSGCRKK